MQLTLITHSTNLCTIGKLYSEHKEFICCTMEKPWINNQRNISCIPGGDYTIKLTNSPRFGQTYKVCDVENRNHILFHKANLESELHGCIAPVSRYGILTNKDRQKEFAGLSSKPAYDKLMKLLGTDDHELTIERY